MKARRIAELGAAAAEKLIQLIAQEARVGTRRNSPRSAVDGARNLPRTAEGRSTLAKIRYLKRGVAHDQFEDLGRKARSGLRLALLATSLLTAAPALAQLSTATIRGQVTNKAVPTPGATIVAKSVDTGAVAHAVAGPNGTYVLSGLSPGAYDVSFTAAGGKPVTERVIVSVGQTASLDIKSSTAGQERCGSGGAGKHAVWRHHRNRATARRNANVQTRTNVTPQQI